MDIQLISELIKELITENDRVSLPGMGSFVVEPAPSVFSDKATILHPPFRRVLFRSKETWNDGLLEERYSQKSGLKPEKAKIELGLFIASVNTELDIKKRVDFPEPLRPTKPILLPRLSVKLIFSKRVCSPKCLERLVT